MPTTQIRPHAPAPLRTDPFIRQQDTCTPWGLHYNAYQDATAPSQPSRPAPPPAAPPANTSPPSPPPDRPPDGPGVLSYGNS